MIKCENLSNTDLDRIGKYIAEAFTAEKGVFAGLSLDDAQKMFKVIVKTCYKSGNLYKTSEKEEGFCVYWTKAQRPSAWTQLKMSIEMLFNVPMSAVKTMINGQKGWTPTEKRYAKADDFVEVFLIIVRPEYQGRGHFKAMLKEPFDLAEKRKTICVLDTDSEVKAQKYSHEGMHIVDRKLLDCKSEMFAMEK